MGFMDFADAVRQAAEMTGESQEVAAITLLEYTANGLSPEPQGWEKIKGEIADAAERLLVALKEQSKSG